MKKPVVLLLDLPCLWHYPRVQHEPSFLESVTPGACCCILSQTMRQYVSHGTPERVGPPRGVRILNQSTGLSKSANYTTNQL